jgi:hypothetical protein
LQLVTYKLAMLFGLTTRKRIVSSGLCSPTVGSSLSYGRLVSTLPVDRLVDRLGTAAE